jgi:hypothetical protein
MVDTGGGKPDLALVKKPAGSILVHLADAFGMSVMLGEGFQRRHRSHPWRRFRCRGSTVAVIPLH